MLKDEDRIFKNLYNDLGADLNSSKKRGDWTNTKDLCERGREWIIDEIKKGELDNTSIDENTFSSFLDTKNYPDPDLLIRTSGELRISNFLLWQLAYTEIFFVDKLWPDFNEKDFNNIIKKFFSIKRNFGKI